MENKVFVPKTNKKVFIYFCLVVVLAAIWVLLFLNQKKNIEETKLVINNETIENNENNETDETKVIGLDTDKVFELDKKVEGTKKYYSDRLGIGFTYLEPEDNSEKELEIKEEGNIISLRDQSIEVFIKNPKYSLEEAIREVFLRTYDPKDCFVVVNEESEQGLANYVSAEISYPPTTDQEAPWWQNSEKCPQTYSKTNWIQYFLMNKDIPGKFMFIKIGQYSAASDGTEGDNEHIYNWTRSIRVLK